MRIALTLLAITITLTATADVYRLRYPLTVDIVDADGKVIGNKKLKSKTLLTEATLTAATAAPTADAPQTSAGRLKPTISPIMFKNTQPRSAVILCDLTLSDFYTGSFENNKGQYWSVNISGRNQDGSIGENIFGYIRKSHRRAPALLKILQDGSTRRVHAQISPAAGDKDLATIEDFELLK